MLDVSGMKCGGCSASVKRILLSNEGVQHAAVNLLTETAVVKLRPAEGLAEEAAQLLTTKVRPFIHYPPSMPDARPIATMQCSDLTFTDGFPIASAHAGASVSCDRRMPWVQGGMRAMRCCPAC